MSSTSISKKSFEEMERRRRREKKREKTFQSTQKSVDASTAPSKQVQFRIEESNTPQEKLNNAQTAEERRKVLKKEKGEQMIVNKIKDLVQLWIRQGGVFIDPIEETFPPQTGQERYVNEYKSQIPIPTPPPQDLRDLFGGDTELTTYMLPLLSKSTSFIQSFKGTFYSIRSSADKALESLNINHPILRLALCTDDSSQSFFPENELGDLRKRSVPLWFHLANDASCDQSARSAKTDSQLLMEIFQNYCARATETHDEACDAIADAILENSSYINISYLCNTLDPGKKKESAVELVKRLVGDYCTSFVKNYFRRLSAYIGLYIEAQLKGYVASPLQDFAKNGSFLKLDYPVTPPGVPRLTGLNRTRNKVTREILYEDSQETMDAERAFGKGPDCQEMNDPFNNESDAKRAVVYNKTNNQHIIGYKLSVVEKIKNRLLGLIVAKKIPLVQEASPGVNIRSLEKGWLKTVFGEKIMNDSIEGAGMSDSSSSSNPYFEKTYTVRADSTLAKGIYILYTYYPPQEDGSIWIPSQDLFLKIRDYKILYQSIIQGYAKACRKRSYGSNEESAEGITCPGMDNHLFIRSRYGIQRLDE